MKLDFKVLKQHHEFIRCNENAMIVGGYGSAKSHTGTIKTILKKLQYPNHSVAYYLPTYALIQDIAFDKFPSILEEYGIQFKLNESKKEINITNYGLIKFRSMDRPENIVGYESAYALIDEADILPMDKMQKVYDKILGRNRAVENSTIDVVSTPEGYKWLYQQSQKGNFKVFKAKTKDNKFLPKNYIAQLEKQYPPQLLKAYMEGEFVNLTSGQVYESYERTLHDTNLIANDRDVLHIGQDFNIGGCVSTVHVISVKNGVEIASRVNEIESYDTRRIVENLRRIYPNNKMVIYPDASGNSSKTNASETDIEILKKAGFLVIVPKKNGFVKDRVNSVNSLLFQGRYFINTSTCPRGAESLEQQAYDKNGEPEKSSDAASIDDYNDSCGYFVVRKYPIKSGGYVAVQG